jgi:TolA-binding protein
LCNIAWQSKRGDKSVKFRLITALAGCAAVALLPSVALAEQKAQPTPEQRIDRLEKQVQQVQRQVFPKGKPADTAGFADDPAATQSSVMSLDQRLDALEKQMSDLVRQSEENGNHLRTLENGIGQLKNDEDRRITAIEQHLADAAAAPPAATPDIVPPPAATPTRPRASGGRATSGATPPPTTEVATAGPIPASDPGEDAYTEGFHEWEAGQYDQAIANLKAFVAAYPRHRRVSYANNLIGRSLMSKGQTRDAAAVFLSNYRGNPGGERAADSLYYLGMATIQLGQPQQACRVYEEFDAIYGTKARADLRKQVSDARAQAQCR